MLIVYASMTGNVERFVNQLPNPSLKITPELSLKEPFILVTYTTGFGSVPELVDTFLTNNALFLRGVAASGNRNWGQYFAVSADQIALKYGVPIILKFELAGNPQVIADFIKGVDQIEISGT